jgi:tetratricopeptide (TPR) repeat protein
LAEALVAALPAPPGAEALIAPILPDLIGEAAILRAFGDPRVNGRAAVERAFVRSGPQVAATLIRAAQDFAGVGYNQPVAWLAALIEREANDPSALLTIADAMPEQSVALAALAARLRNRITEILRQLAATDADRFLPLLASSLAELGKRLSALGRCGAGLGATQQAVRLFRTLAAANPDAYELELAIVLNNLSNRLSELGRHGAALGPAEEAVEIWRRLAAVNPDAYEPGLAMALNNLANRLSELGRREEALSAAEEAVEIRSKLAAANLDAYEPDLAMALTNLGNRLSELGRREEALGPAEGGGRTFS